MEATKMSPAKGLQTIRKANIMAIVAVCITLFSGVLLAVLMLAGINPGQADNTTATGILAILAGGSGLLALVGLVLMFISHVREFVGLVRLSKVHAGYKTALSLIISNLVASVIIVLLPVDDSIITALLQLLNLLCIASVYFILGTTAVLLQGEGNAELATQGLRVRALYVGCNVVSVAALLLALLPALTLIADIVTLVSSIIQLVALFKYIGFLGRAAVALED